MSHDLSERFEQLLVGRKRPRPTASPALEQLPGASSSPAAGRAGDQVPSNENEAMKLPRCTTEQQEGRRAMAERYALARVEAQRVLAAAVANYNKVAQDGAERLAVARENSRLAAAAHCEAQRGFAESAAHLAAMKRRLLLRKGAAPAPALIAEQRAVQA